MMQLDILFNESAVKTINFESYSDEPQKVSFRDLVPEIKNTSYLTHSVYYYPAKFIPQVVRFCLNEYTQKGDWVIDPFAGSGTVGLEANICERNACLTDINLLLNHIIPLKICREKELLNGAELRDRLTYVITQEACFMPSWSNIAYWYPPEFLAILQKLWGAQKMLEQDIYALIIEAALIKISKFFSYAEHKTPKLFKSKSKKIYIGELLNKNWKLDLINMLQKSSYEIFNDINSYLAIYKNNKSEILYYGGVDSANFEIKEDIELDCLITSPPYLQAQEYIRTVKLDLYWLGYKEADVKRISGLEIPYRPANKIIETQTLNKVRAELIRKDLHKIINSYFDHTISALEKATLKLKKGGKACIFVGNPKIDGIEVETWRILTEYFTKKSFLPYAIFDDTIKNRQLFKSRKNKNPDGMKSEFLLVLEKT